MSAAKLREAASLMRKRAEAVLSNARENGEETGGPGAWYSPAFIEDAFRKHAPVDPPYSAACETAWETAWETSGDLLASWHPAVALAVADWLDEAADHLAVEDGDDDGLGHICPTAIEGLECSVLGQALAVADAYLGGEQS